jgi:hypothetical protein
MSEFFVGYLDTPPRTKRFALAAGAVLVVLVVVSGLLWGLSQRRAGTATWDIATVVERQGVLQTVPYGMLHQTAEDGTVTTTLLVEATKHGLRPSAAQYDGQAVAIRGTILSRSGEDMMSLEPGEDAIRTVEGSATVPAAMDLGTVTLSGRAVDSKCFLGAMKPGDGSGHRPCARLCIRGGIPPVLISNDPEHPYVILAGPDGEALAKERILPLVAQPHTYTGRLRRMGTLEILDWAR